MVILLLKIFLFCVVFVNISGFHPNKMSDYNQKDNGTNPINEISSQTNLRTDPQSQRRSIAERIRDIPRLNIERRPSAYSWTRNLDDFPIRVASPGFWSLSPSSQSPNMFTNSYSQIIPPVTIPNDAPQEMVGSSSGAHATMMISNKNLPNQSIDGDLSPQEGKTGIDDIPTSESVDITSGESNADPTGAPLLPYFDSEVVAETDHISLESGAEDYDKDKEYNQEEDKDKEKDHNIVV